MPSPYDTCHDRKTRPAPTSKHHFQPFNEALPSLFLIYAIALEVSGDSAPSDAED